MIRMDAERSASLQLPDENLTAIDPVCGMEVDLADAAGRIAHQVRDYFFCSAHCVEAFSADPEKYLHADSSAGREMHPAVPPAAAEYTCPMHPEIVRDGAGACPICGM